MNLGTIWKDFGRFWKILEGLEGFLDTSFIDIFRDFFRYIWIFFRQFFLYYLNIFGNFLGIFWIFFEYFLDIFWILYVSSEIFERTCKSQWNDPIGDSGFAGFPSPLPPPPAINHSKRLGTGRILRDSNHQNGFNRINAYQSGAQGRHGALPDIGFRVANGREDDVEECLHLLEKERRHEPCQLAQHQHLKSFNYWFIIQSKCISSNCIESWHWSFIG